MKVLWTSDYTTTPATQTWSSSGAAVGGPLCTIHVHLPVSAMMIAASSVTVVETDNPGHTPNPQNMAGGAQYGSCPTGCPHAPTTAHFSVPLWCTTGLHNAQHTIAVSGSYWVMGGPPPMFMTLLVFSGSTSVDVCNLLVAMTDPVNPEPVLWQGDPQQPVTLNAGVSSAYRANQPVKLTIFASDQTPVFQTDTWVTPIGNGSTLLEYAWNGQRNIGGTGTVEKGVYLFKWEVGGPGPYMDWDRDKSATIQLGATSSEVDRHAAGDNASTWEVEHTITSAFGRSASSGNCRVFDIDLVQWAYWPLVGADLDPGSHTVSKTLADPTLAVPVFLNSVRDSDGDVDRGHRMRWALQHNREDPPKDAVLFAHRDYYPGPAFSVEPTWRAMAAMGYTGIKDGSLIGHLWYNGDQWTTSENIRRALEHVWPGPAAAKTLRVLGLFGHGNPAGKALMVRGPTLLEGRPVPAGNRWVFPTWLYHETSSDLLGRSSSHTVTPGLAGLDLNTVQPRNENDQKKTSHATALANLDLVVVIGCDMARDGLGWAFRALGARRTVSVGGRDSEAHCEAAFIEPFWKMVKEGVAVSEAAEKALLSARAEQRMHGQAYGDYPIEAKWTGAAIGTPLDPPKKL